MNSTQDLRTYSKTESFTVSTAVGTTTANLTLSGDLSTGDAVSFRSTTSGEVPLVSSYDAISRKLSISGLTENQSRTLTVYYKSPALGETPQIAEAINYLPAGIVAMALCLAGAAVIYGVGGKH